jgi:3-hydroxyisobutyrate dehydrogenase-like beta-hydroxyacid dehydrogenase
LIIRNIFKDSTEKTIMTRLGILHPGKMGISVAASAQKSGCKVFWVSDGRSEHTQQRADEHFLEDALTLENLCQTCDIIISICPPHAAENIATQVLTAGFKGLYLDANAISPQRSKSLRDLMEVASLDYVDGGIIGGPAWEPGRTWLYLSGREAQRVAACFSAGPLEVDLIGDEIGKASALKMCFAAYTKGTSALLSSILAAAQELDVRDVLEKQWSRGGSDFAQKTQDRVRHVTAKAWRFEGEMEEIASTFAGVGLPRGFHLASAEIYHRMAEFKEAPKTPELDIVLKALLHKTPDQD